MASRKIHVYSDGNKMIAMKIFHMSVINLKSNALGICVQIIFPQTRLPLIKYLYILINITGNPRKTDLTLPHSADINR